MGGNAAQIMATANQTAINKGKNEERKTLGPYELIRKLGQGGMATVFLARHHDSDPSLPLVVVKRLHENLEKDKNAVDLFLTEADVTMLLDHPNVIQVHDSGEANGNYYIAMEYVEGRDLEYIFLRLSSQGLAMPPELATQIMINVLDGLAYVHNAKTPTGRDLGIVHRDATPSNVYVSKTGCVKLGDFGVAKLAGIENWTMAGSLKGKLGYLSPEQIQGEPPAQSIDLWAAAVIFYELITGTRAFSGDQELEVMLRIKNGKIEDARTRNKNVPASLNAIVSRALHKKEKKRFSCAADFRDALIGYQEKNSHIYSENEVVEHLRYVMRKRAPV